MRLETRGTDSYLTTSNDPFLERNLTQISSDEDLQKNLRNILHTVQIGLLLFLGEHQENGGYQWLFLMGLVFYHPIYRALGF